MNSKHDLKRVSLLKIILILIVFFICGFVFIYNNLSYNMEKPIKLSVENQQAILDELGITIPQGAKLGKCYKHSRNKWLDVEIVGIKDIGRAFNENFLYKDKLDDFEQKKLNEWFMYPDSQSDIYERWNGQNQMKYYENSILNKLYFSDAGPYFTSNYGKHSGFEFAFSTRSGEIDTFIYKSGESYNIAIHKEQSSI